MFDKINKFFPYVAMAALALMISWGAWKFNNYENELVRLRNQAAEKDKTVEVLKDTYTKLATENEDLKASNKEVQKLLDKSKQDLLTETQATVTWKQAYQYALTHGPGQPPMLPPGQPPPVVQKCTESPLVYTSVQDIGLLKLTIDTTTIDPGYTQRLTVDKGSKPLKLTLNITRDRNKQFHSLVTSSDERLAVDIGVNSVNFEPLEERWYERLKLVADIGAGNGLDSLVGVGGTYEFGKWELGPKFWLTTSGKSYAGATFSWAPFKQVN